MLLSDWEAVVDAVVQTTGVVKQEIQKLLQNAMKEATPELETRRYLEMDEKAKDSQSIKRFLDNLDTTGKRMPLRLHLYNTTSNAIDLWVLSVDQLAPRMVLVAVLYRASREDEPQAEMPSPDSLHDDMEDLFRDWLEAEATDKSEEPKPGDVEEEEEPLEAHVEDLVDALVDANLAQRDEVSQCTSHHAEAGPAARTLQNGTPPVAAGAKPDVRALLNSTLSSIGASSIPAPIKMVTTTYVPAKSGGLCSDCGLRHWNAERCLNSHLCQSCGAKGHAEFKCRFANKACKICRGDSHAPWRCPEKAEASDAYDGNKLWGILHGKSKFWQKRREELGLGSRYIAR